MTERMLKGLRILLVEDEFLIAMDLKDMLGAAGARVVGPFATLATAHAAARNERVDLAILDIDLAGEEVFPAAAILLQRGIPFLFHTGRPERETLRAAFSGVPVCPKPATPQLLLAKLARLVPMAA